MTTPDTLVVDTSPERSFRLDGRTVVVTGASSGLGARFAVVAAHAGAKVLAVARRADRLEALAEAAPSIEPIVADITDADDVDRLDRRLADGGVDVLLNNAGAAGDADPLTEPVEHFRHVLDVNLVGLYRVTQVAARQMVERGRGSIVNVASIMGQVASAPITQPGYCAAKAGVINLTRELAVSWARRGLRVNAIAPGFFPSEITAHMWSDESTVGFINRNCPMARAGASDELDGAFLFLASDASTYVTGQVLAVDGGWTAR